LRCNAHAQSLLADTIDLLSPRLNYYFFFLLLTDVLSFSVALPILPLFIVEVVRQSMGVDASQIDVVQRAAMIQGAVSGLDGIIKFICQPMLGKAKHTSPLYDT
jgi:hypothetical protein